MENREKTADNTGFEASESIPSDTLPPTTFLNPAQTISPASIMYKNTCVCETILIQATLTLQNNKSIKI